MNQIYKDNTFKIYQIKDRRDKNEYILQNYKMEGFAHTHINNYNACIKLISLSMKNKTPMDLSVYLIESLIRINDDEEYIRKLNELLEAKHKKHDNYRNINKGA